MAIFSISESGGTRRKLTQLYLDKGDDRRLLGVAHAREYDPDTDSYKFTGKVDLKTGKETISPFNKYHGTGKGNDAYNPKVNHLDSNNKRGKEYVKDVYYSKDEDKLENKKPGSILKKQEEKKKSIKEAAEFILSILDESEKKNELIDEGFFSKKPKLTQEDVSKIVSAFKEESKSIEIHHPNKADSLYSSINFNVNHNTSGQQYMKGYAIGIVEPDMVAMYCHDDIVKGCKKIKSKLVDEFPAIKDIVFVNSTIIVTD